jgi:2-iminoacetate synthase
MTFARLFHLSDRPRSRTISQFAALLEPMQDASLNRLVGQSQAITRRFFGRTMRLFAPLYLSSECVNNCQYCGFSRDNPIMRVTLSTDEVETEARYLVQQGFRNILLVSGEHPKFVSNGYLLDVILRLVSFVPSVSIEVAPMEADDYRPLVSAGAEGLVVYQATGDWKLRHAATKPVFAGSESLPYSDWRNGDPRQLLSLNMSNTCLRNAGAPN